MKTLVIGTGGREHALARALARDPGVTEVHAAPGNPGMAAVATLHDVDPLDGPSVAALAASLGVDLVVVGPEAPLVAGVADAVRTAGIAAFGPSAWAARLEGSKAFAKEVMEAAGVPTARAFVCGTTEEAAAALDELGAPYVVKDDGLAAGKGVVVTDDRAEALAHAIGCCVGGGRVVIEEYLDGPEVSLFGVTDGSTVYPLPPAQDFKRIFDGDEGPNTGGMGAYTPLPWAPPGLVDEVLATVLQPTVDELARRGTPFTGLLYAGLALTSRGVRVIEFNVRFGDPETQPLLTLLESPLGELLMAASTRTLSDVAAPVFADGAAVAVVMASRGYPASSSSGDVITGVDVADSLPGVHVIHAGTALRDGPGGDELVTAGGRVLAVVGTGPTWPPPAPRRTPASRDLLRRRPAPDGHRRRPVTFAPGTVVTVREVLHGQTWAEFPETVVHDDGEVLARVQADGSPLTFPEHPWPHPWGHLTAWQGTTVLKLRRLGDCYSVWKFFEDGLFASWYVNFETPVVRRDDGVDINDLQLDVVIERDGSWRWKDFETWLPRWRPDG